jgi:hypothetical protein
LIGSGRACKVIDLECDLQPDENGNPRNSRPQRKRPDAVILNGRRRPGDGFSNYANIFIQRTDGATGTETEPEKKSGMSIADSIKMRRRTAHAAR